MRVFLIGANISKTPYAVYPLGLSMVASAAERAGHEVQQFDFLHHDQSLASLTEALRAFCPHVVGISIRNIDNVNLLHEQRYVEAVQDIVRCVKASTSVPIVLGGSGFSILPEAILAQTGAEYGIVGEGERALTDLLACLERGEKPSSRCVRGREPLPGAHIPSPSYDPALLKFYLAHGGIAALQTKRGCVHQCVYCTYPMLEGHEIRSRDPDEVVSDIEHLVKDLDAKYVFFTDSVFNDAEGQYMDLIEAMRRKELCVPWTAFFTPTGLTDDGIERMKETGLRAVELGSDAAASGTLKGLGKGFTFEDILESNDLLVRHGVAVAHYFMFGGPGETPETIQEGVENLGKLQKTVAFVFMGIRILPGTLLYERAIQERVIAPDQNLIEPCYYLSEGLDRTWLEQTLRESFKTMRHVIFPPDALDSALAFLHRMGYAGSLWDMLIEAQSRDRRRRLPGTGPCGEERS